jgi:hypothetical protein
MDSREIIADVIPWADQQGFRNIAAELHRALSLLEQREARPHKQRKR